MILLCLYSQILCGWLLYYTDFSPVVFAVFILLYFGAGQLLSFYGRMSPYERPLLYSMPGSMLSISLATGSWWILCIMVLFFHWWILPASILVSLLFGHFLLRPMAQLLLVYPIYGYNKLLGRL